MDIFKRNIIKMSLKDSYLTIKETGEGLYTESRSKFFSFALHVNNEEEVKSYLALYRKKFYDARHVCYAYVLGDEGEITRQNDDGEPAGTAGAPIGRQLRSYGLTYVLLVVVRYFGGVKLGTSRLGVAYKAAALEALENSQTIECIIKEKFRISVPYSEADIAMRYIRDAGANIIDREYTATDNLLSVEIRLSDAENIKKSLSQIYTLKFIKDECVKTNASLKIN